MDTQNRRVSYDRVLPHSFATGHDNARHNNIFIAPRTDVHNRFDGGGKSYLKNLDRDSVDNIIEKYKNEKLKQKCYKYGDHNLNRSKGEHALFQINSEYKHSVQNVVHYVRPEILSKSNNKDIEFSINKHNLKINKNSATKVTFAEPNSSIHRNLEFCKRISLTSREKLYADKTTYCRPVVSLFNEELIYKTMERNMKLKQLVKKLAIARNREKESVTWNNFINELKNKHSLSCYNSRWTHLLPHESEQYIKSETIDYYANNGSSSQQSSPCRLLLEDLYKGCNHHAQSAHTYCQNNTNNNKQSYYNHHAKPYTTDSHCYPTSSQGRLMILERERQRTEHQQHLKNNNFKYEKNYKYKNYSERNLAKKEYSRNSYSFKHNKNISNRNSVESIAIQTNHYFDREDYKKNTENVYINTSDELIQICDNDNKIQKKYQYSANNIQKLSFKNIDNKIESLISTINSFINEIKLSRKLQSEQKANAVLGTPKSCNYEKTARTSTRTKNDDKVGGTKRNELICGGKFNDTYINTWPVCNFRPCSKPSQTDDLITGNDKFCSSGNSTFKGQPCSVNITFEVPTRDCSTEVTKSLNEHHCDDKIETIEEISTCEPAPLQHMTIAVNTDPFNFLTLLRISTQAVMRLLSNVPYLNYHSYLAMFPFPQLTRTAESHYICNICGAAFNKPSALSDHIQEHNLGKTRDCCVCRHVLETSKSPRGLFKCKFCGQVFTRAYCCELHQKCCGQRLGFTTDVSSSLMLLS